MGRCCDDIQGCDLRHKVEFQAPNPTTDSYGAEQNKWLSPTTVLRTRACVDPLSGRELTYAQALQRQVTHRITIRYNAVVKGRTDYRIKYDGRYFNIRSIIDLEERHKFFEITAEEGTPT